MLDGNMAWKAMAPLVFDSVYRIVSGEAPKPLAVTVPLTRRCACAQGITVTPPFTSATASDEGLLLLWETGVE